MNGHHIILNLTRVYLLQDEINDGSLNFEDLQALNRNSELIWPQFVGNMVPVIKRVVKFCKKLPGKSRWS
jgi:hypothetical protein